MTQNNFKLDARQFPRQKFGLSLREYAEDESRRKLVLYARQEILSAEERPKDSIASLRDALRLPKRSVVEERDAVISLISEGVNHYRNAYSYEIDPRLNEKLFSAPRYRDVTVADLAALIEDIERKVEIRPDVIGRAGFSNEQWNGILEATGQALLAADAAPTAKLPKGEPTKLRLMRDCVKLYEKIRVLVPQAVRKIGVAALGVALFAGLILAAPTIGVPMTVGAIVGIAIYRHYTAAPRSKQDEAAQIQKLAKLLVEKWGPEFAKKPDVALAPYRNLVLASDGARFSSDLRRDLLSAGWVVSDAVLCGAVKEAFKTLSIKHAKITLEARESDSSEEKLHLAGDKYTSERSDAGDENRVITTFSPEKKGDKVILRRLNQLPRENTELRRLNDRVLEQARILEQSPLSEPFKGRSSTGYLGMVKLKDGYIGQVYEDYRDWLTISDVGEILRWAVTAKSSTEKKKEEEWVRNIEQLLIADATELSGRFSGMSVPPGAFAVDAGGNLRYSLAQWLDETDVAVNDHPSEPESMEIVYSDTPLSTSSGSFQIDDVSETGMSAATDEATEGMTGPLIAFQALPQIGGPGVTDKPVFDLQLTQSEKKIRDHLVGLIKEYRAGQVKSEKTMPHVRNIAGGDFNVNLSAPSAPKALPAPKKQNLLARLRSNLAKKI